MEPALHSFAYSLDFLAEQVADLQDADLVRQPQGISNHPAWVIGHLTYTFQLLGEVLGLPAWLPEDFQTRFGAGSVPLPDASVHEPKGLALARLRDAQLRVALAVRQVDDARLAEPFPDPLYLDVFPTIRHAITQVLVGHTAYHVGQVGVWRRCMGLPPMKRSFE